MILNRNRLDFPWFSMENMFYDIFYVFCYKMVPVANHLRKKSVVYRNNAALWWRTHVKATVQGRSSHQRRESSKPKCVWLSPVFLPLSCPVSITGVKLLCVCCQQLECLCSWSRNIPGNQIGLQNNPTFNLMTSTRLHFQVRLEHMVG